MPKSSFFSPFVPTSAPRSLPQISVTTLTNLAQSSAESLGMDLEPQNEPQPPQQLDKQLAVAATPLPSHVIPPRPRYGLRVPTSKDFMLPTRGFVQPEQFPELFEAIARFKANLGGRPAVVISCRLCYFCSLDPGQFLGHCELHPLYRMSQRKPDTDGTIFAKCSRCHELVCFGRYRNAEGKFLSARPDLEGFYLLELSQEQLKQESQHSDLKIGTIKRHLLHRAQASNHYARQALEEPRLRAPLFENLHLRSFLQCSRLPKELAESYSVFVWVGSRCSMTSLELFCLSVGWLFFV